MTAPAPPVPKQSQSVAGEEDPGAANDMAPPAGDSVAARDGAGQGVPGDDAPPGTPGTGENACPNCGGRGRVDGHACRTCGGTGKVNTAIGGG